MDWVAFGKFIVEAEDWLIPLVFSIIFASVSVFNSSTQAKQQVTQISIELIEKRLQYYNACNKLLDAMINSGSLTETVIHTYNEQIFGIEFFFGSDVQKHCDEINNLVKESRDLSNRRSKPSEIDFENIDHDSRVLQHKARRMKDDSKYVFDAYLDFSCYKASGEKK